MSWLWVMALAACTEGGPDACRDDALSRLDLDDSAWVSEHVSPGGGTLQQLADGWALGWGYDYVVFSPEGLRGVAQSPRRAVLTDDAAWLLTTKHRPGGCTSQGRLSWHAAPTGLVARVAAGVHRAPVRAAASRFEMPLSDGPHDLLWTDGGAVIVDADRAEAAARCRDVPVWSADGRFQACIVDEEGAESVAIARGAWGRGRWHADHLRPRAMSWAGDGSALVVHDGEARVAMLEPGLIAPSVRWQVEITGLVDAIATRDGSLVVLALEDRIAFLDAATGRRLDDPTRPPTDFEIRRPPPPVPTPARPPTSPPACRAVDLDVALPGFPLEQGFQIAESASGCTLAVRGVRALFTVDVATGQVHPFVAGRWPGELRFTGEDLAIVDQGGWAPNQDLWRRDGHLRENFDRGPRRSVDDRGRVGHLVDGRYWVVQDDAFHLVPPPTPLAAHGYITEQVDGPATLIRDHRGEIVCMVPTHAELVASLSGRMVMFAERGPTIVRLPECVTVGRPPGRFEVPTSPAIGPRRASSEHIVVLDGWVVQLRPAVRIAPGPGRDRPGRWRHDMFTDDDALEVPGLEEVLGFQRLASGHFAFVTPRGLVVRSVERLLDEAIPLAPPRECGSTPERTRSGRGRWSRCTGQGARPE